MKHDDENPWELNGISIFHDCVAFFVKMGYLNAFNRMGCEIANSKIPKASSVSHWHPFKQRNYRLSTKNSCNFTFQSNFQSITARICSKSMPKNQHFNHTYKEKILSSIIMLSLCSVCVSEWKMEKFSKIVYLENMEIIS